MAVVLYVSAAGLTALIAVIGLVAVTGRSRSVDWSTVLVGAMLLVGFGTVLIWQFNRGRPVARVALAGVTAYFTFGLTLDLVVVAAGESSAPVIVFIIEAVRTGCAIAATVLAFSASAQVYFAAYDEGETPAAATGLPAWFWGLGVALLTVQLAVSFIDQLPGGDRSWATWATSRSAATTLQVGATLCLVPAYAALVRHFRFCRQWARVTLTVLGVLLGVVAALQIVVVFGRGVPDGLAIAFGVLEAAQLAALIIAVVLSYRPALNAHFRGRRP